MASRRPIVSTLLAGLTVLLAGCSAPPDEVGEEPEGPRLAWEDAFEVTEDATAAFVNLTIVRNAPEAGIGTLHVTGPDGAVVVERDLQWSASEDRVIVEMRWGDVEDATTDHALTPGTWTYTVHATGFIDVFATIKVLDPTNGEREN